MAQRYEVLKIDALEKIEKTPEDFLRLPARVTRTGVFIYRKADGTLKKEFRSPEEVFNADSLSTLLAKPVTNNHPKEGKVDSSNAKQHAVGFTSDSIQEDGKFVKVFLNVMDEKAIQDIKKGKRELSCGYTCQVTDSEGEVNGERYDSVQSNIRYNHVALVHRGRAGSEVRLSLDNDDAVLESEAISEPENKDDELSHGDIKTQLQALVSKNLSRSQHVWVRDVFSDHFIYSVGENDKLLRQSYRIRGDTIELIGEQVEVIQKTEFIKKEDEMEFTTIKIDEKEVKVSSKDAPIVTEFIKDQASKVGELEGKLKDSEETKSDLENTEILLDKANGKIKGYKATIAELEKKIDQFDEKVKEASLERANLRKIAETVLDAEEMEKIDSMSSVDIKKAIISKKTDLKLDDASEAHIDSCFEVICNLKENPKDKLGSTITQGRADDAGTEKEDARERAMKRQKDSYKRNENKQGGN